MKRKLIAVVFAVMATTIVSAQSNKEIVKTGINLGPLPVVAFDADRGFQYGALLNIYNFDDGSTYPNPHRPGCWKHRLTLKAVTSL